MVSEDSRMPLFVQRCAIFAMLGVVKNPASSGNTRVKTEMKHSIPIVLRKVSTLY